MESLLGTRKRNKIIAILEYKKLVNCIKKISWLTRGNDFKIGENGYA